VVDLPACRPRSGGRLSKSSGAALLSAGLPGCRRARTRAPPAGAAGLGRGRGRRAHRVEALAGQLGRDLWMVGLPWARSGTSTTSSSWSSPSGSEKTMPGGGGRPHPGARRDQYFGEGRSAPERLDESSRRRARRPVAIPAPPAGAAPGVLRRRSDRAPVNRPQFGEVRGGSGRVVLVDVLLTSRRPQHRRGEVDFGWGSSVIRCYVVDALSCTLHV